MSQPKKISEQTLPPLYANWVESFLSGGIPEETDATCNDCAMCDVGRDRSVKASNENYFLPEVKCCTYMPSLPNFNVGRILSDPTTLPHGIETVRARIRNRVGVTPVRLATTTHYGNLYSLSGVKAFGKSKELLCPHYVSDGGLCGIWKNRESVCSTYFCKTVRGTVGKNFWRDGITPLLQSIEREVSLWAAIELGISSEALGALLSASQQTMWDAADVEGRVDDKKYETLWGKYAGDEESFYIKCGDLVSRMDWSDISKICGSEVKARIAITRARYKQLMSTDLPTAVTVGQINVVGVKADSVEVQTSTGHFDLSKDVFNVLLDFDGRSLEETRAALIRDKDIEIDDDLIRTLLDHEILIAV